MTVDAISTSERTTLVRGRWVIQGPEDNAVASDAGVLVQDGLIAAVDDWTTLDRAHPDAERIGSSEHAVMPGLINAHHHSHGVSSLQQGIPDRLLEPWIMSLAATRGGDRRPETLLAAGALLRSGVTGVVDVLSASGDAAGFEAQVRAAMDAYAESGMRAAVAAGYGSRSRLVHGEGEDGRFLASLPEPVRSKAQLLAATRAGAPLAEDEYFELMTRIHHAAAAHPRVALWFGPPGPQWVSEALLVRSAELAKAWGVGVQTHVNESFYEKLHGARSYGRPTVAHLAELGVLGPHFSIAHGVWCTEAEIELLAATGTAVSHNPSSNLRLHAGIAPLNQLLAAGVTMALGMDGTTLGDDEDMFAEMRLAARLHRAPQLGQPAPTFAQVFGMATTGGARLLGQKLGRLLPGYAADLVLVDLERITWPWVAPECHPRDLVLARARAGDVDTVLVDGEVVLRGGLPTRIDLRAAGEAFAARLQAATVPHGIADAIRAVLPYLEAWYGEWPQPPLESWLTVSSRR